MRIALGIVFGAVVALAACGGHQVQLGGTDGAAPMDTDGGANRGNESESDDPFFLQSVVAPGACVFSSDPTQAALKFGVLDVDVEASFAGAYYAVFLAGYRFADAGMPTIEASRIIVQGATVTVTDGSGHQLASYTAPGESGGDSLGSIYGTTWYEPVTFEIVDSSTIMALRSKLGLFERETIVTYTRAFGTTLGGQIVESNVFEFPIEVCAGCLIHFDTNTSREPQPNCYGPLPATKGQAPCYFGQDVPVDCHACAQTSSVCLCGQDTACPTNVTPDAGP